MKLIQSYFKLDSRICPDVEKWIMIFSVRIADSVERI